MKVPVPSETLKYPLEATTSTCSADLGEFSLSLMSTLVLTEYPSERG